MNRLLGEPAAPLGRRPRRALWWSILLSALGYLAVSLWGGWKDVLDALQTVGLPGLAVALSLSLANYGLRFIRWQYYLGLLGHRLPWRYHLRTYVAGFSLTTTPGKAGEMLRSVLLAGRGVPYPKSLAAFLAERLSDLMAILALATLGLWGYPSARPVVLASIGAALLVLAVLRSSALLGALNDFLVRRLPDRAGRIVSGSTATAAYFRTCATLPAMLYGLALGLVAWGAEGLAFYYVLQLLQSDLTFGAALFIYAFSVLVGALSFLPGGLGGTETTMVGMLLASGMGEPSAVASTILIRIATLWFAVILGMAALGGQSHAK